MDGNSQLSGGSSWTVPKNDSDNGSCLNERRECNGELDKELARTKGTTRVNIHEGTQLGGQSPLAKEPTSMDQRTGSVVVMNIPNLPSSSGSIDGSERPSSLNKVQHLPGTVNCKRPLPAGSSLPPVQWASERPLKISRSRLANVVSPVSNLDEVLVLSEGFTAPDEGAKLTSMEASGVLVSRDMINCTHQIKMKFENDPSAAGLSESENSGVPESKSKEKKIDNIEIEDGTLDAVPKAATCDLSTKKNKLPLKEEIGDRARRQGRSGRSSLQSNVSLSITKEKLENVEATKPLKNEKPVSDKTERIGQPPSKKVSHRKGCTRRGQNISSGSSNLAVESEDDLEELLAAAKAARTASSVASSSAFWKKMETFFACVTSEDLAHLKHQINFAEELEGSSCDLLVTDQSEMGEIKCQALSSSDICQQASQTMVGLNKSDGTPCSTNESPLLKIASQELEQERSCGKIIPLSQRLLSAFITEDESKMYDASIKPGDEFLRFSSVSPYGANSHVRNELNPVVDANHDLKIQTNCYGRNIPCNGCPTPHSFTSPNNFISCDETLQENHALIHSDAEEVSKVVQSNPNRREALAADSSGTSSYECQFEHTSLDDRILMELHSIGIYPDTVGVVDEIDKVISELKIKLCQEVSKKKSLVGKLEKAIQEETEHEGRHVEQLAMDKLVEMAYKRLRGRRGGSRRKGGVSKNSKQLALGFANRTLARCRGFEKTGESCFSKPILRDYLFSEPSHTSNATDIDGIKLGTSANMYVESRKFPLTLQVSASGAMASDVSSNLIERHAPSHKLHKGPLDPIPCFTAKSDSVSNRGTKSEVLLHEAVTNATSRVTPTLNNTLPGGAKWTKTDKNKDRGTLSRNSVQRSGLPSLWSSRGERKTKTKSKQKIAQLSTSGNDIGRAKETTFVLPSMGDSCETSHNGNTKVRQETELPSSHNSSHDLSKEMEDHTLLKGMDSIDELDVADGLGGQGQDIPSWLNFDEDAFKDQDLICLGIPMDDLADLTLKF